MSPGLWSIVPRADNELVTADIYNGDRNDIVNHIEPLYVDDYSATVAQMRAETNPGTVGGESLAVSLAGELERIRYVLHHVLDPAGTAWYSALAKKVSGAPVHNVIFYGAAGNAAADDTVPIQQALDAAAASGGQAIVVMPPGTYRVTGPLTVHTGLTLRGAGMGKTSINSTVTSGVILNIPAGAVGVTLDGFTVAGPAGSQPGLNAIYAAGGQDLRIRSVKTVFAEQGVLLNNVTGGILDGVIATSVGIGFRLTGCTWGECRTCQATSVDRSGFFLDGGTRLITMTSCVAFDTGRTQDVSPLSIIGGQDVVVVNFSAANPAAKTAAAISADAASARVVVLNCQRTNTGAVNLKPSTTPWALTDGQVDSVWAIRAWALVNGANGAIRRAAGVASVVRSGVGIYTLTWTQPFAAGTDYAVVASALTLGYLATPTSQTPTGCTVRVFYQLTGEHVDSDFNVQVTGARL
jgi:hypothetical protein